MSWLPKEFIYPSNCTFRPSPPSSVLLLFASSRLFSRFALMLVAIEHVITFVTEKLLRLVDKLECRLEISVEIGGDGEASSFVLPAVPRNSFHRFDTRGKSDDSKNTWMSKHCIRSFVWVSGVRR